MKSFTVDTSTLGPLMVRVAPTPRLNDAGQPQTDDNGQVVNLGRVVLPGVMSSIYGTPSPRQVRLKLLGQVPADLADGSTIVLHGRVTLTSWYMPRARGRDSRSEATLTPERVEVVHGQVPTFTGMIPTVPPTDPFFYMAARPREGGDGWEVGAIVPASVVDQEGTQVVFVDQAPPDGLEGRPIRFEGMRVAVVVPDADDVGRNSKSQFVVYADRVVPADAQPVTAGRPRRQDPEPAPETPAEG